MKKICFILLLTFGFTYANDSSSLNNSQNVPAVGDILVINATSNTNYNYIDLPKLNVIVKKGGLATYKPVHGNHVVVTDVKTKNDGNVQVILEKKDNTKFFGISKQVKADYIKAISSGELSKL